MESWRREAKILTTGLSVRFKQPLCRRDRDPKNLRIGGLCESGVRDLASSETAWGKWQNISLFSSQ
jgi:hypothetical protein